MNFCKKCGKPFEPKVGYKNYCSNVCKIKKPVCGWNKGIKGSTGDHRGEKNSYHKLTDEQKLNFARTGAAKVNSQSHLYSQKKSDAMHRKIDSGYRPQDNAGWGKGYRTAPRQTNEEYNSVNKKIGEYLGL